MKKLLVLTGLLLPVLGFAQSYSINWYKIAGGGGASGGTNGSTVYSLTGTIGQHDAGGAMSGGAYSVTGGFWSLISVAETPGLPYLSIAHAGTSVVISWPNTGSYTLQQNNNLAASASWVATSYSITTSGGTNSITISAPAGSLFFRLANP
jgi:hypothetical protein